MVMDPSRVVFSHIVNVESLRVPLVIFTEVRLDRLIPRVAVAEVLLIVSWSNPVVTPLIKDADVQENVMFTLFVVSSKPALLVKLPLILKSEAAIMLAEAATVR